MKRMAPERYEVAPRRAQVRLYLRARDAAQHLGLAPKTLANWRASGKGPRFCRLGRVIVYRVEDLDRFVAFCLEH